MDQAPCLDHCPDIGIGYHGNQMDMTCTDFPGTALKVTDLRVGVSGGFSPHRNETHM